jgi:hypothetical protein
VLMTKESFKIKLKSGCIMVMPFLQKNTMLLLLMMSSKDCIANE